MTFKLRVFHLWHVLFMSFAIVKSSACVFADISIAAVDLLQEMTDIESDEDNEDAINAFLDALVCITLHNANHLCTAFRA